MHSIEFERVPFLSSGSLHGARKLSGLARWESKEYSRPNGRQNPPWAKICPLKGCLNVEQVCRKLGHLQQKDAKSLFSTQFEVFTF